MKNLKLLMIVDDLCGWILMAALTPLVKLATKLAKRDHDLSCPRNLFFLKMLGGGSLIIAYPTLFSLKKKFPDAPFTIVTTPSVKPFACALGLFDEIIVINNRGLCSLFFSSISALRRSVHADTFVDLEVYSRLSCVFTALTMARNRIGFYLTDPFLRKGLNTHLIFFNQNAGVHDLYDLILRLFYSKLADIREARAHFLKINGLKGYRSRKSRQIGIGHACSNFAGERMLSAMQWKTVLTSRLENCADTRFFLLGGKSDSQFAEDIIKTVKQSFSNLSIENLCSLPTLNDTIKKIAELDEFWTIDSALNHIARLIGIKVISFWGPTDPQLRLRYMPDLAEEVHYKKIPCSPCVHINRTPPCNSNNVCIAQLFSADKQGSNVDSPVIIFPLVAKKTFLF